MSYLKYLPYLLVIIIALALFNIKGQVAEERSQREFWQEQYESAREKYLKKTEAYDKTLKELRSRKRKIVEVITKPDGTIVNRTETEEERTEIRDREQSNSNTETAEKESSSGAASGEKQSSQKTGPFLKPYSISVSHPPISFDPRLVRFDFGARLGQLPLTATVGSDGHFSNFYVGLRYEF